MNNANEQDSKANQPDLKSNSIMRKISNISARTNISRDTSFVKEFFRSISAISKTLSERHKQDEPDQQVEIRRPVYNLDNFDAEYGYELNETSMKSWFQAKIKKQCACSKQRLLSIFYSFFPFLTWIPEYKWKIGGIADLLAGFTVGIMSIPQGMAYSRLAGVPPVYGLYTNLVPTFLYFFFGTSRLGAMGTVAVVSLMMGIIRFKHLPIGDYSEGCFALYGNNSSINMEDFVSSSPDCFSSVDLAVATSMLSGFLFICMGFLRLGFVSQYLSDQLVGGFTAGAAIHVFTSQIDVTFGLNLKPREGPGKLIFIYTELFSQIKNVHVATLVGSLVCVVFLLIIKEIIDPRLRKYLKVPIPGELILVIIGTLISYFVGLKNIYGMNVVGKIPNGFPVPKAPRFDLMNQLFVEALVLTIVNYSLSVSLAKLYAKRNNYKIDPYQEFFAYGIMNIFGSCFRAWPSGQSVARSIVYESAGARSQFAGMIGTFVVLLTIFFIAPFLSALPQCILGSIILVACLEMLTGMKELKPLFLTSKIDFSIYVVAFVAVVLLDVTEGLAASVLYAFLTVIFRTQCPHVRIMGNIPKTDLYGEVNHYTRAEQFSKLKVFSFNAPLYYANAENFKPKLYKKCNVDPQKIKEDKSHQAKKQNSKIVANVVEDVENQKQKPECDQDLQQKNGSNHDDVPKFVVINCSGFTYIDLMGFNALKQVYVDLKKVGITVYFADCNATVRETLQVAKFYDTVPKCNVFVTVHDAVTAANNAIASSDSNEREVDDNDSGVMTNRVNCAPVFTISYPDEEKDNFSISSGIGESESSKPEIDRL